MRTLDRDLLAVGSGSGRLSAAVTAPWHGLVAFFQRHTALRIVRPATVICRSMSGSTPCRRTPTSPSRHR